MASHVVNRGRSISWRRRIPVRLVSAFRRSHLTLSLRTRDPVKARRLARRLSVVFDEFIEAMETANRQPTPQEQQALLDAFRSLIRDRCETARSLGFRPTQEQWNEYLGRAPTTLGELKRIELDEEAYRQSYPAAQAAYEERVQAHIESAPFRNVTRLAGEWQDALDRNDTRAVRDLVDETLATSGVSIHPNSLAYTRFARRPLREGVEVLRQIESEDARPISAAATKSPMPLKPSQRLSQLIEPFIADKSASHEDHKGYVAQTEKQTRVTFRLWQELNGDLPIREYTREHAWRFYDTMRRMPRHHGKSEKDERTILEQIEWADAQETEVERLKLKTVKRHFSSLNQLWKWARNRGQVEDVVTNGFEFPGTRSGKNKRSAWPDDMLLKLFQSDWWAPHAERDTARYWGALIALHSGLRREEFCQLYVDDIREQDGIPFVRLEETDGRRLKTSSSTRDVPVHPFLIELGFLDFVERRRKRKAKFLFPDIRPEAPVGKRGDRLTKDFGTYIRRIGIDDRKIVLHSFRHNFRTALESTKLKESWIDAVMGHENPKRSEGGRTYAKFLSLDAAAEVVRSFVCPVDLSFLKK